MKAATEMSEKGNPKDDSPFVEGKESDEKLPAHGKEDSEELGKPSGSRAGNAAALSAPKVDPSSFFDTMEESDILMGRGKRTNNRPANTHLRERAEDQALSYARLTTKKEKREFSRKFIDEIESTGARFVEAASVSYNGSYKTAYSIVPRNVVEVKIKQLLRDRAAIILAQNQKDSLTDRAPSIGRTPTRTSMPT